MRSFLTSKNNLYLSFSDLPSNLTTSASSVLLARINHPPWVLFTLTPSNEITSLELYFLKTLLDIFSIVENLILSEQKTLISGETYVLGKDDTNLSSSILLAIKLRTLTDA